MSVDQFEQQRRDALRVRALELAIARAGTTGGEVLPTAKFYYEFLLSDEHALPGA